MTPQVYSATLPLYKAPTRRLREFVSKFASDPDFLAQVVFTRGSKIVKFVHHTQDITLTIPLSIFLKGDASASADYTAISRFCTKFNMLSAFAPIARINDSCGSIFQLELEEDPQNFKGIADDDAVALLIANFLINDPAVLLAVDNLFKLLDS